MTIDYGLAGKVVLITGVSRRMGIGAALTHGFAQAEAHVFTTFYDASPDLSNTQQMLGMEMDLSDPEAACRIFDQAEKAFGGVDILINNATHDQETDITALTAEILDAHYVVNVRGTTLLCAEFIKRWRGSSGGRIISLTSGQSLDPMPDNLPYAMTKGAIEVLTKSLGATLARQGITINAVDPGPTDTGWIVGAIRTRLEAAAPQGRVGLPEDAVRLTLFLASSQADWITGQVIHSRGGF